jgi:hypothetical protein
MDFSIYSINTSIDFVKIPYRRFFINFKLIVPRLSKLNKHQIIPHYALAHTNNYTEQELLFCTWRFFHMVIWRMYVTCKIFTHSPNHFQTTRFCRILDLLWWKFRRTFNLELLSWQGDCRGVLLWGNIKKYLDIYWRNGNRWWGSKRISYVQLLCSLLLSVCTGSWRRWTILMNRFLKCCRNES